MNARLGVRMLVLAAAATMAAPAAAEFSKSYKFLDAVRSKDGQAVIDELNQPGSTIVNTRDSGNGQTALHIVVARRDVPWLSLLIGKGADPNISDNRGSTPLMIAVTLGFNEGVELLLAGNARVDEPNATGETPLIAAVHRRDIAVMRMLLKAGANPDRADSSGRSARDYAALDGPDSPLVTEINTNARARRGGSGTYGPRL